MKVIVNRLLAALGLVFILVGTSEAQISVVESVGTFNVFSTFSPVAPLSGDISNTGDVFILNDIETSGELYLNNVLFMNRNAAPTDGDQSIFFADSASRTGESLIWDDSDDAFRLSDDLIVDFGHNITAQSEGFLQLRSEGVQMRFVIDSDADNGLTSPHLFIWYNDSPVDANRVMQLQSNSTDVGDLFIDGQLTENTNFDIAEAFWSGTGLEPGTLVAVDPARPDAVVPSQGSYDARVVGVVSTAPGIVLGGHAFSVEKLARAWGDEVAAELEQMRSSLEASVYAEGPELQAERDRLHSEATWGSFLQQEMVEAGAFPEIAAGGEEEGAVPSAPSLDPDEVAESYAQALADHRMVVDDAVMQRFFSERFALVALAGRVPVRVDASYGPIEAGDPLTASPTPGVAMKADRSSVVVGMALEDLTAGQETILMLVDRDWYPGEAIQVAAGGGAAEHELASLRRHNAELTSRLDSLSAVVETLARAADLPETGPQLAEATELRRP